MPDNNGIEPGFIDELLARPTWEQQTELLRSRKLLDADGLGWLLDVADRLLNDNPDKAERLAGLSIRLAGVVGAPAAVPRAQYVRAGVRHLNGQFNEDIRLTKWAHDGYVALDMNLEALRTNVGKMAALLEMGHYEETLDTGQVVLDALDGKGGPDVRPTPQESDLLTALVHQNRGRCYEQMGRYGRALDAWKVAEEKYRELGMKERVAEIMNNRGTILSYLGRGDEALASHEAAAAIFSEANLTLSHAMSLSNVGSTHLRHANYMSGLDAFKQARRLLEPFDAHAEEYFLLRNIADVYLALNLHSEALASYREVDGLLKDTELRQDRAQTLWGMGSALIAQGELEQARGALDEAARLFAAADNPPMLSGVMLEQSSLLAALGSRTEAVSIARRALELVSGGYWPVQEIYANLRLADLLLPDEMAAETHLVAAQRLASHLALPQLRYRLNERLGRLRRLQGREEEALTLLEAAVDEIERLRGTVAQDAMRASFLRDKTAAYEDLLRLHLARDGEESARRAFAIAERAKSRALVDLLTGVTGKEAVGSGDLGTEERVRALQADLDGIYGELLGGAADGGENPTALPALRARASDLEGEISRLRLQVATVEPSSHVFAAPVPLDSPQNRIEPGTVLLAYHVVGDEILAFVAVEGRTRVVRALGTVLGVNKLLNKLDVQWERFRAGQEFAGRHMAMMERSTRHLMAALYDGLVAPLERLLEEARGLVPSDETSSIPKLAVVPHGPLHRVPFHALFDGERYLIDRFEFSYAPSATVYALCQERVSQARGGAAVFGVEDPSIPFAATEVLAVAERLPGAEVRVGEDATIEALRDGAAQSDALHLACHGLFRSDNPMFSALKLHDGWLTAADAMSLDLPGALVTLSACESALGGVIGGDEVLGLSRAFLGAGAATLVVSLWLVQDETTAELMRGYYERLRRNARPAKALRDAQLEIKDRYAHPYYWAPFVLIGKR